MQLNPKDLEGRPRPLEPGERWFVLIFALLVGGLFAAEILQDFTPVKSSIFFFFLAWAPLILLHELGHAWMARAWGWQVHEVVVGFGRVVKRWQWGDARVELRAIPLGGHMVPVPHGRAPVRLASFCVYAAGPGIELAVVGLLALLLGADVLTTASDHYGIIAAQAVCVAALLGAVTNLVPLSTASGAWTDGKGMLMSAWLDDAHFDRMRASPQLVEGERALVAGDAEGALAIYEAGLVRFPAVVALHLGRARALLQLDRRLEALMNLQTAARQADLAPRVRAELEAVLQWARAQKTG